MIVSRFLSELSIGISFLNSSSASTGKHTRSLPWVSWSWLSLRPMIRGSESSVAPYLIDATPPAVVMARRIMVADGRCNRSTTVARNTSHMAKATERTVLGAVAIVITRVVVNLIQDAHGFRFFTDNRLHWSVHFTRPFRSFSSMLAQILQDSFQQFTKRVDLLRTHTLYRASTHPRRTFHSRLAEFLRTLIETNQLSTAV